MYRYISGKTSIDGNPVFIITVKQSDGSTVLLRNYSTSGAESQARFTIDIQKSANSTAKVLELKFQ